MLALPLFHRFPAVRRCVLGLAVAVLCGCTQIGPASVADARFDYNEAIVHSFDHQMLLNLVRLRYQDSVLFLDLTSVVASYRRERSVGTSGSATLPSSITLGLTGNASWSESPTITYAPLQGEDFAKRMLSPIHPTSILLLSRSGWGIERIFMCTVQQLNELMNGSTLGGVSPSNIRHLQKFHRAVTLLRELEEGGQVQVNTLTGRGDMVTVIPGPVPMDAESRAKATELLHLLNVTPKPPEHAPKHEPNEAPDSPGSSQEHPQNPAPPETKPEHEHPTGSPKYASSEASPPQWSLTIGGARFPYSPAHIAIAGRSMLGVMAFLAQHVEVPAEHVQQGLVKRAKGPDGKPFEWKDASWHLFRVQSSRTKPEQAYLRISYRGYWFWIDDTDLESKSTYTLLAQLFSLQAATGNIQTPILTIPAK